MVLNRLKNKLDQWLGSESPPDLPSPTDDFPDAWRKILERRVWIYRLLDPAQAERLERWVLGFLWHIPFEGCSGLKITDEMRVTVAAWASLLVLNRPQPKYPYLHRVLIYPDGYRIKEGGFFFPEEDTGFDAAGESWDEGYVILAWTDVVRSTETEDSFNVVLHEMAHQLDLEGGEVDGVPVLDPVLRRRWEDVAARSFERFQGFLATAETHVIDAYGGEDPVEFFAVATEAFFGDAVGLKEDYPELYGLFQELYGFDPVEWFEPIPDSHGEDSGNSSRSRS